MKASQEPPSTANLKAHRALVHYVMGLLLVLSALA